MSVGVKILASAGAGGGVSLKKCGKNLAPVSLQHMAPKHYTLTSALVSLLSTTIALSENLMEK